MADIFAIQDEITAAIVDSLKVALKLGERAVLRKRSTDDPEAYSLYLKGRSLAGLLTQEGYRSALDYLERAAAKDPGFALPLAAISSVYVGRAHWGYMRPHDAMPKAREYARKALDMDDSLGLAYAVSGYVKGFYDWDWPGADLDFKRALELNPNSPDIRHSYSLFLTCAERHDEAVIEARKAWELDPLSSTISSHAGEVLFFAGRADEAVEILKETISLDPSFYFAHWGLYLIYTEKSMFQEALAECEKAAELSGGHPFPVIGLIFTYNRLGRTAEADKLQRSLRDRSKTEYIAPICFYYIHLVRKEFEQAAEWLEKACVERDSFLPWILVHPNPTRRIPDLPIFNDILEKHGLKGLAWIPTAPIGTGLS
jgi:adenylate cyclase